MELSGRLVLTFRCNVEVGGVVVGQLRRLHPVGICLEGKQNEKNNLVLFTASA